MSGRQTLRTAAHRLRKEIFAVICQDVARVQFEVAAGGTGNGRTSQAR